MLVLLTPAIASLRTLSHTFVRSRGMIGEQGVTNRLGQDKTRKVRAVGWGRNGQQIPTTRQTLRSNRHNLRISATRYRPSAFVTL